MLALTAAPQKIIRFARDQLFRGWVQTGGEERRFSGREIAAALYEGMLGRSPDPHGLHNLTRALMLGKPVDEAMREIIGSGEFRMRMIRELIPARELPDLLALYPERYSREPDPDGGTKLLYHAPTDAEFDFMETAIVQHRYYDAPGVWSAGIGLDQQVTAAIALGLGARTCLELGCFTGGALSLLAEAGVDVTGLDVSHLAFMLAFPNVRNRMVFGDLLSAPLPPQHDVVLAMDIVEHLNPVRFDQYLARIAGLVAKDGYFYLNSPMFGRDDVFGELFGVYLQAWQGNTDGFFRQLDCDEKGWPKHGHLVWATPQWWEARLAAHGLVRDRGLERAIHAELNVFFESSPARRSFFVLKHASNERDSAAVAASLRDRLRAVPNLPR